MKTSTLLIIGAVVVLGLFLLAQAQRAVPGNNKNLSKPSSNFWDFLGKVSVAGIGKLGSSSAGNSSPSSSGSSSDDLADVDLGD